MKIEIKMVPEVSKKNIMLFCEKNKINHKNMWYISIFVLYIISSLSFLILRNPTPKYQKYIVRESVIFF